MKLPPSMPINPASLSEALLTVRVEDLELSVRTVNCLTSAGIGTVGDVVDLLNRGRTEVLRVPNLGAKSYRELYEIVGGLASSTRNDMLRWINDHADEIQAVRDGRAAIVPTWRGLTPEG